LAGVKPGMSRASTVSQTECRRGWLAVEVRRGPSTPARCLGEKNASAAPLGWFAACEIAAILIHMIKSDPIAHSEGLIWQSQVRLLGQ